MKKSEMERNEYEQKIFDGNKLILERQKELLELHKKLEKVIKSRFVKIENRIKKLEKKQNANDSRRFWRKEIHNSRRWI